MATSEERTGSGSVNIDRQLAELDPIEEANAAEELNNDLDGVRQPRDENVKVMVRCRPLLGPLERESCVQVHEADKCIELADRQFQFNAVFGPDSDNENVYMKSARQLVEFAFRGYNCTVFLYGQTGTGKTHTHSSLSQSSFAHLFSLIGDSNKQAQFLIRASYYELYNENIRDLLTNSSKPLELRESKARGVYVKDLTSYLVNCVSDLEKLKMMGDKQRITAATKMNEHSSRSHSILSITIETVDHNPSSAESKILSEKRTKISRDRASTAIASIRVGRLHLIDLAGSERQSKSGSTGAHLKEASRINLSLTCLSLVIRALTDTNSNHVPYRNSKLTRLLSGSLGGNSKTLLIACISPARTNLEETMSTLRFASRTKRIKNKARVNEDAKDALLRRYRRQIDELKSKLREQQRRTTSSVVSEDEAIELLVKGQQQQHHHHHQTSPGEDKSPQNTNEQLQQLRLLRSKIMVGGENLLEKAEMHERLLEASRQELEEKRLEEAKLKEKLEKKREAIERMAQTKGSLESQVLNLDEKLKRALVLYKKTKGEQRDLISEHQQLKESLLHSIRATSREIKYADCIIEDFIPRDYLDLINTYAQYDEESDEWQIKYIALSGNNIAQTRKMTEGRGVMS